ncbi:matrix extracellular phosphoglycoprotein [Heliangelus exortis]|uniref:matrix extracellular phosphoglycoprotein n=1 Tax=Heliangelus exortis TaxID=472823 RepID=UPI003A8DED61
MQTALVCLCLCLLSTTLSTPVPPPLPGRAAAKCVGQHQILLKGCNAKHGFYIFKYVYSFSTRRNQTQIKKEEADRQNVIPGHQLGEDDGRWELTESGVALERDDNVRTDEMENRTGLKPESNTTPDAGTDPHPDTITRGGVGIAGPTLTSLEGSGDLDLVVEVDGGVSTPTWDGHPGKTVVGNKSIVRSEDRDDGAPGWVPVEGTMTAGRERAPATGGAGDEGSGEATNLGQGQGSVLQGTGTGGSALSSVTEKTEDVQVDAKGVDEYAYIPDSGSITVTRGKVGSTVGTTSFTQISPDKDDEVNIFIGRANIHVGEQEATQAGATSGSEDDGVPTAGASSPLPRVGTTVAQDDDAAIPAHRQPEGLATTATPSHGDSITRRPGDGHPMGEDEDRTTTFGYGAGPTAQSPWRVTRDDVTVPVEADIHGNGDDEIRGEGERFEGSPGSVPVTTSRQEDDQEATATVPAEGVSIHLGTIVASPRVKEGNCTSALGMTSSCKAGQSAAMEREGSREAGPTTPQPLGDDRPGGAGLDKTPRTDKAPSSRRKPGSQALRGAQAMAGGHSGDAGGSLHTAEAQAGRDRGSAAARRVPERSRGGEAGAAGAVERGGRVSARRGRRPGAGAPGAFAALSRSRQVDQVKRADELHIRERAFYTLGGAGGGPRSPYAGPGSADSSQSSEGERGSRSDSRQVGLLRPSGWGAPGHPQGRWSRGTL